MLLQDKSAIVTGGDTGIGAAIVRALASEGARVTIDYVGDSTPAKALQDELTKAGQHALAVAGDVSKAHDVERLVASTVAAFGGLDILVNNAGVEHRYPFVDTPDEVWDLVLGVNLRGPYLCSKAAAREMISQGRGGRIVNISSVHEDVTAPTNAPYCAAKGGLRMLMRTIAVELAQHKVTVNNVGPGAIDTPMDAATKRNPTLDEELLGEIPLRRWGKPEEVAGLVVWLCSDAAAYVTGASMFIDGGMMRQAGSL
ncbi:MAG: SDR family oxidoreductase [Candidatus Eremiobacteraeota bacterium]|nr:SDR family oxidoreductase [Candidatus Eremiobacteraeota bacterium]